MKEVLDGAKVQGPILQTIMLFSDVISPAFVALPEMDHLIEKIFKIINTTNVKDNSGIRAYSALVTKLWPVASPEQVSELQDLAVSRHCQ